MVVVDGDLELTGTTVGDISYIVVYYDVTTGNLYNSNGDLFGNSTLTTFLDNTFTLEIHYVKDVSTSNNPEEWTVWDGLEGKTVASTLAFDNDFVHAVKGSVSVSGSTVVVSGSTNLNVDVSSSSESISETTLDTTGQLIINPFSSSKQVVSYNSFSVTDSVFSFVLVSGLTSSVPVNSPVRVEAPLYLNIGTDTIYEANIPSRYNEGVFKFPMYIMSRKLLDALDYSGVSSVSGTLEHKIYVKKNTISGISVSGSSAILSRNKNQDVTAVDSSDNTSYLFCYWTNGTTSYWTKGNDVQDGSALYTVSNGTATAQTATANPVYDTESVLFRTFSFPFTVNNLVSYGTGFNVPALDTDFTKEYLISLLRNNIITTGSGSYTFSNEFTVSGIAVSVNSIAMGKISGLTSAINAKQNKLTSSNAGTGISISNTGVISVSNIPQASVTGLTTSLSGKQDKLTSSNAGTGISISNTGVITANYIGPFAVNVVSSSGQNRGVSVEKGNVVVGNKQYPVNAIASNSAVTISSGYDLYLFGSYDSANSSASFYYSAYSSGVAISTNEFYTKIAENRGGVVKQIQYGNIVTVPWNLGEAGGAGGMSEEQVTSAINSAVNALVTRYGLTPVPQILYAAPTVSADITSPTKSNVTLTASNWDNAVVSKQYSSNGVGWLTYTDGGVLMTANGSRYFRGIDSNGDMTMTAVYSVTNIDKTAPTINLMGFNSNSYESQTISANAIDKGSSVTIYYSPDSSSWDSSTSTAVIPVTSSGTWYFFAVDAVGNERNASVTFPNIGGTPPSSSGGSGGSSIVIDDSDEPPPT